MSRVGKRPIPIPAGVTVTVEGTTCVVKGPKGELRQHVPAGLGYEQAEGQLTITRPNESKPMKAKHGLVRALIANQVKGVTQGWSRTLLIEGVGYRAAAKGKTLDLQMQFSHPVEYAIPAGVTIATPEPTPVPTPTLTPAEIARKEGLRPGARLEWVTSPQYAPLLEGLVDLHPGGSPGLAGPG